MRKPIVGLYAALLVLAGSACGGDDAGGGGGGAPGVNALAAAAETAADAGSARMTMSMAMTAAGQDMDLTAEGTLDFDDEVGEMTMTIEVPGLGAPQTVDMVFEDQFVYTKLPAGVAGAGAGGWVRMDLSSMPGVGAGGANQFAQDPSQFLEYLRGASDEVEEVGSEEIRGVPTTHYRTELSFEKMLDQAPDQEAVEKLRTQLDAFGSVDSLPSEVWIDEDGLPRRITMAMSAEAGGQTMDIDVSMDLFDYGVDVAIDPPKKFEELEPPAG